MRVKPKKKLGQHFLINEVICQQIVNALPQQEKKIMVLEIGPGMGAITKYLVVRDDIELRAFEIDSESMVYLNENFPTLHGKIWNEDFLKANLKSILGDQSFCVVGNFPYNISSQILFKCLEYRNQIPVIMGMFQKEVAQRVAEKPGSKTYGIISVLLQAFYKIDYCFTVEPTAFFPPPKVKSGVIICTRNQRESLGCDEKLFFKVVKMAFNQRRKTLRNSLKQLIGDHPLDEKFHNERPERLGVEEFIELTSSIEKYYGK